MADRDKIPSSVPRRYKGIYKQVCEQQAPEQIARSILRPLRKDIKTLGNDPVDLINKVATQLKPVAGNSLLKNVFDWDVEHQEIDELQREITGNLEGLEWAAMACHQILSRLEFGEQIQDVEFEISKQYILNLYDARFHENILYSQQDHKEIDQETVEKHLNIVRHYLEQEIEPFAKLLAKHGNVNSLRLSRQDKQPVDIYGGDIMQGIIV